MYVCTHICFFFLNGLLTLAWTKHKRNKGAKWVSPPSMSCKPRMRKRRRRYNHVFFSARNLAYWALLSHPSSSRDTRSSVARRRPSSIVPGTKKEMHQNPFVLLWTILYFLSNTTTNNKAVICVNLTKRDSNWTTSLLSIQGQPNNPLFPSSLLWCHLFSLDLCCTRSYNISLPFISHPHPSPPLLPMPHTTLSEKAYGHII